MIASRRIMRIGSICVLFPFRMKRLYIAYTGGTIGMRRTAVGYAPAPGFLAEQMRAMPELADPTMPAYDIHEYEPLLDSSNMRPADWVRIGRDIVEHYDDYDGFIVLHGTDTMAYTASALPFFIRGLAKPVIITGSQIPLVRGAQRCAQQPRHLDVDRERGRRSRRSASTSATSCCAAAGRPRCMPTRSRRSIRLTIHRSAWSAWMWKST